MTATSQVIQCPACGAKNRVSLARTADEQPICGRCKSPLPVGATGAGDGKPVVVTDATFAAVVERAGVPVLLDLWAPWCGPCRMLAPTLDQLAAEYANRALIAKLNVDENPGTAMRFDARSIPLLVLLQNGREVDRLVGVQPAPQIKQRLERVLAR